MSANEQNCGQPPLPQQTAPPSDPRVRNASEDGICRDYIWGICTKDTQCRYRHERNVESMKKILRFCHDFQNRSGCNRPGCTYLHTSNEEENLFLRNGQIPSVLLDRYAAMASASNQNNSNMYLNDILTQPPPPPPPLPPPVTAIRPASVLPSTLPAPLQSILAPPPPPPPPTVAPTPLQVTAPLFTAPPPIPSTYPVNQPAISLPVFDASRPPPPLSTPILNKTVALKRPGETLEAVPSKLRKQDQGTKLENSLCEQCIQRQIRMELYRNKMNTLERERELQSLRYEQKLEAFENGKLLLKSAFSPELYRILDEYIESSSLLVQTPSQQYNQLSLATGSSSLPRQLLCSVMEIIRNFVGPHNEFGHSTERTNASIVDLIRTASAAQNVRTGLNPFGALNGKVNVGAGTSTNRFLSSTNTTSRPLQTSSTPNAVHASNSQNVEQIIDRGFTIPNVTKRLPTPQTIPQSFQAQHQSLATSIPNTLLARRATLPQSLQAQHQSLASSVPPRLQNTKQPSLTHNVLANVGGTTKIHLQQTRPHSTSGLHPQTIAHNTTSTRNVNVSTTHASVAAHVPNTVYTQNGTAPQRAIRPASSHLPNASQTQLNLLHPHNGMQPPNASQVQSFAQHQELSHVQNISSSNVTAPYGQYSTAVPPPPRPTYEPAQNNMAHMPHMPYSPRLNTTPPRAQSTAQNSFYYGMARFSNYFNQQPYQ